MKTNQGDWNYFKPEVSAELIIDNFEIGNSTESEWNELWEKQIFPQFQGIVNAVLNDEKERVKEDSLSTATHDDSY